MNPGVSPSAPSSSKPPMLTMRSFFWMRVLRLIRGPRLERFGALSSSHWLHPFENAAGSMGSVDPAGLSCC